jgi:hypothetical protein
MASTVSASKSMTTLTGSGMPSGGSCAWSDSIGIMSSGFIGPSPPLAGAVWANESFTIAEQALTKYCIRQGTSCNHPSGKVKIDAAYVAVNTPIVREQLQKSGVRLAHMLDAALGKQ